MYVCVCVCARSHTQKTLIRCIVLVREYKAVLLISETPILFRTVFCLVFSFFEMFTNAINIRR